MTVTTTNTDIPAEGVPGHRVLVWAQTNVGRPLASAAHEIDFLVWLANESTIALDVEIVENGYWAELPEHISRYRPTVLHYIGHGRRGSLMVRDRDSAGFPVEVEISPDQFADVLRDAGTWLRGVFLNGCETAHWAPHLIPQGGWIVGINYKVDDHLASEFSSNFYTTLADGGSVEVAFGTGLDEVRGHLRFRKGTFVRWFEDPDPDDFLHKVFSRQAFLTSTLEEESLLDLSNALKDVRHALKTNGLALRHDLGMSRQVSCRTPFSKELVAPLLDQLKVVRDDLSHLRRRFPLVVKYGDGWMEVPQDEIGTLLHLADRLDHSRNELLRLVNRIIPVNKNFQMIMPTSKTWRWAGFSNFV